MNVVFKNKKRNKCFFDKYRRICTNDHHFIPADSPYIHSWTFNILRSGVRVSFRVFYFTYCQVPGDIPGVSGMFRDAPLFPTMATPLEKALFSKGSRCRKVRLWYKAVSGFGKNKLAIRRSFTPFQTLVQATNQGGEQTKLNTKWCN